MAVPIKGNSDKGRQSFLSPVSFRTGWVRAREGAVLLRALALLNGFPGCR